MISKEQKDIQISTSEDGSSAGILFVDVFDGGERLKRALKILGLFWLLAAVSILIPIAHWGLVPGFFIAGPIMAFSRYRMSEAMEKASGPCPKCQEAVDIELEPSDRLPLWTYCPKCNHSVQLTFNQTT